MTSNSTSAIPIIDFAPFQHPTSPTSRLETAKALVNACRHFGFVYIINHDIPSSLLKEAFAMTKQLFDLPHEAKMQAPHPPGPSIHRGYSYPGLEKVYQVISDNTELGEKMRGVKDCKVSLFNRLGYPLTVLILLYHKLQLRKALTQIYVD